MDEIALEFAGRPVLEMVAAFGDPYEIAEVLPNLPAPQRRAIEVVLLLRGFSQQLQYLITGLIVLSVIMLHTIGERR
jgi:hypothetical protein